MHAQAMPGHLIRRMQQVATQIFTARTRAAGFDITSVQFAALDAIHDNPGIDQAGVAAIIAYDRATIGGVIDRLVAKGWVERRVSHRDRRAREVRLTTAGDALLAAVLPVVDAVQSEILADLDAAGRETFLRLARQVANPTSDNPSGC